MKKFKFLRKNKLVALILSFKKKGNGEKILYKQWQKLHTVYSEFLFFMISKNKHIIVKFLQIKFCKNKWITRIGIIFKIRQKMK